MQRFMRFVLLKLFMDIKQEGLVKEGVDFDAWLENSGILEDK